MNRAAAVVCVALLCLAGCGGVDHVTTVTSSSALASAAISTIVKAPSVMETPRPLTTPMPTATLTPIATPSPTPTPIATPTPLPTPMHTPASTAVASPFSLTVRDSNDSNDTVTPVSTYQVETEFATGVTNGYQPVDPKTVFTVADKWVYFIYQVANVPADSSFEIAWVAVDVPGLGNNYEFQHDNCDCHYTVSADRVGFFAIGSPPSGYLAGSYRVDLYLNETLIGTYPFVVQ